MLNYFFEDFLMAINSSGQINIAEEAILFSFLDLQTFAFIKYAFKLALWKVFLIFFPLQLLPVSERFGIWAKVGFDSKWQMGISVSIYWVFLQEERALKLMAQLKEQTACDPMISELLSFLCQNYNQNEPILMQRNCKFCVSEKWLYTW